MLFSIIVPVYNIEKWIAECVDSVLCQEFEDYELILVDDGSTDSSGKICDRYAGDNSRVRAFHKPNGGLSDARNYGTEYARGEYILYVDGDDYIAGQALQKLARSIQSNTPDIVLAEGWYLDHSDEIKLKKLFDRSEIYGITGQETLLNTTAIYPNWAAWGKCFRRSFWTENHFSFQKGRLAEDFQIIDQVILQAEKVNMVEAYYFYRIRDHSIMQSVNEKMMDDLLLNFSDWKKYFETHVMEERIARQMYALMARELNHNVLGYIGLVKTDHRKDLLREASKYVFFLNYDDSKESKLIRSCIRFMGIKMTCLLLGKIKKYRKARGH